MPYEDKAETARWEVGKMRSLPEPQGHAFIDQYFDADLVSHENRKGPNDPMNPISPKVWTGGAGAALGATISTLLIWLVGASAFHGGWAADRVDNAIAAVPSPLAGFILLLVTGTLAMVGVYAKTDPERLPTLGEEQRKRAGLQGVDVRPRRADLSENDADGDVVR